MEAIAALAVQMMSDFFLLFASVPFTAPSRSFFLFSFPMRFVSLFLMIALVPALFLVGAVEGRPASQISDSMDTNRDGKVTTEEEAKFLETLHGNLDKDRDGSISGQELFGVRCLHALPFS